MDVSLITFLRAVRGKTIATGKFSREFTIPSVCLHHLTVSNQSHFASWRMSPGFLFLFFISVLWPHQIACICAGKQLPPHGLIALCDLHHLTMV